MIVKNEETVSKRFKLPWKFSMEESVFNEEEWLNKWIKTKLFWCVGEIHKLCYEMIIKFKRL